MKTNGIRFFVSPVPGGGYLVEKIKDSKVIESFRGSTLTPDEVAQHMQDKGLSNACIIAFLGLSSKSLSVKTLSI